MRKAWQVQEVMRLAGKKKSQRAISAKVGISRNVVASIIQGCAGHGEAAASGDGASPDPIPPRKRCSVCGNHVELPCRICQARRFRQRRPPRTDDPEPGPSDQLQLELKPQHRARYEKVHAAKVQQEREAFDLEKRQALGMERLRRKILDRPSAPVQSRRKKGRPPP